MDNFFQNKYVQALIIFLAVLGLISVVQSVQFYVMQDENVMSNEVDEGFGHMHDDSHEHSDTEEGIMGDMHMMGSAEAVDYTGTHIMPNGQVMSGAGMVVTDAVILENGDVQLSDGTVLTSVADFRN